jgi:non-SMC mitotic condensation complex subunit 1
MEDEMGLAAASDYDHEKQFNYIVERELVFENLLGKFHPFIAFIVANEEKGRQGFGPYGAPIIRETALLALCRYMCVSNAMCEMYLALVFTALENEAMAVNRTTVMIALADLAFRFPNVIEPWTKRIYSRLSDDDTVVRYNTLMVLTHLILNDMIKVKGQVSHVVMMLNDPCFEIRELATLFFTKLSERSNNPIYNLLGDIIATLSRDRKQKEKEKQIPELSSGSGEIMKNNEGENEKLKKNENESDNNENENKIKDGDSDLMDVVSEVEKEVKKEGVHYDENEFEVEVVHVAVVDLEEEHFPSRTLCVKEFQTTLHFLLSFVKKDKQADGLFERLIIRLGMAQTLIQKRNLAFCISELSVGVKGLKKLIELFRHIRGALHDGQVFESIKLTVAKAKKMHTMRHSNSAGDDGEEKSGEEVVKTAVKSKGKAKKSMLNKNNEGGEGGGGEGDTNVQPIVSSDDFKCVIEELENLLKEFGNVKTKSGDNQNENDGDEEGNTETHNGDNNDDEEVEEGGGGGRGNESKNKKASVKSKVTEKTKSKPASKGSKGKKIEESSDEESEEEEDDEEEEEEEKAVPVVAKNKKVEKKVLNKNKAAANSDTEEEDEMDFE